MVAVNYSCNKDDINSYGQMSATINGKQVNLRADEAKFYVRPANLITILGSNCKEGYVVIILEVPPAVGSYTLDGISDMNFYISRAIACDESGSSTPRKVIEANVNVIEITTTRIKGTFNLIAENTNPAITVIDIIENGTFDVAREERIE
jgi:hypothetical protein